MVFRLASKKAQNTLHLSPTTVTPLRYVAIVPDVWAAMFGASQNFWDIVKEILQEKG